MSLKIFPVKTGEQVELQINALNHSGEGVGRFQGLAVFVPFTVPGEEVRVRIKEVKKNFARAELLSVLKAGGSRCLPCCNAHGRCGGCQFQHMDYPEQLRGKTRLVEDALLRIGKLKGIKVLPTLGMESPWRYRNKVHFKVERDGEELFLGYYGSGNFGEENDPVGIVGRGPTLSRQLLRVEECSLIDEDMNKVVKVVKELLNCYKPSGVRQELFRHVMLRKSSRSGEIMVVLVTETAQWPDGRRMAEELMIRCPQVVSVIRNENTAKNQVVMGQFTRVLAGKTKLLDEIGGINFNISPESFFQINPVQTRVIYDTVLEYAGLTGRETVVDAFCGIGTISLYLAKKAGKVYGLEIVPEAVKDARENARLNNIDNTEFVVGKTEELLPKLYQQGVKPDMVVLDPPRKGCEQKALVAIGEMKPQRVVYVSCDPGSLARDLAVLDGLGYKTVEVQPVDMFPQTAHVEICVLLSKK